MDIGVGLWVILGCYLLLLIGIGIFGHLVSEKNSLGDHYLASSGLTGLTLFMTLFASNFSGYNMIGIPGDTYRIGYTSLMWIPGLVCICLGFLFLSSSLYRIGFIKNYLTPLEFIKDRYQSNILLLLVGINSLIPMLIYITAQCKAMGDIMEGLTSGVISGFWGSVGLGVVMLLYEILGGMRSIAITDVVQGSILLLGMVILLVSSVVEYGGLWYISQQIRDKSPQLTQVPDLRDSVSWLSFNFQLLFNPFYYHILQRFLASKSEHTIKRSVVILSFTPYIAGIAPITIGLIGLSLFDVSDQESDQIFSLVMSDLMSKGDIYYWIVCFIISSAVAAIMSTGDSGLMAVSSMVSLDLVKSHLLKNRSDRFYLVIGKISSFVVLLICVILANVVKLNLKNLLGLQLSLTMQVAPAYILGLRVPSINSFPIIGGMIWGMIVTFGLIIVDVKPLGIEAGVFGLLLNVCVIICIYCAISLKHDNYAPDMLHSTVGEPYKIGKKRYIFHM
eukprot:TRINITY_DN1370_c0_g1_i3.p1 TRINITY_DN1370_c0_g1~~TRINITY_DN1370_c0_g1_i3.p1  ORF type:complete len:504 (-),score=41.17 TRINITY_DN1370_c0_g1_i3:289-1800(-)